MAAGGIDIEEGVSVEDEPGADSGMGLDVLAAVAGRASCERLVVVTVA